MEDKLPILKCFVCEKDLESVNHDSIAQVYGGGSIEISFGYGSRKWDIIAFREPVHEPGFYDHVWEILTNEPPSPDASKYEAKTENGIMYSVPRKRAEDASRAEKLASCSHIYGVICDECFENKSHLLKGYETDPAMYEKHPKYVKPKLVVE